MDRARAALRERDERVASAIGRTARLDLVFERRGRRTVVAHAYCEPPFRIGRCLDLDGAAYVIVVCSGPGVFAGDLLRQTVRVGSGARVVLTSQSALQVHPAVAPQPATVDHRCVLDDDAELHCEWDPVIPFADARLAQRFDVRMPSSARLWWSDAIMAGRISRGEVWRFRQLAHELRLTVDGALQYLERYAIVPAERDVDRAWMAGAATHLATTIVHHERATADAAQAMHDALGAFAGTRAAADLVEPRLLVSRLMATDGAAFAAARAAGRRLALATVFESPQLAGRKSV
jgi:urease accessory protein UreH